MILRCKKIQKHNRSSRFCYYEKIEKCRSKFWENGLLWRRFLQMNMRCWKLWRQYPERSRLDEIPSSWLSLLRLTTDETFRSSMKQNSFKYTMQRSANMYKSSDSQFFRTTTGIQSGPDALEKSMSVWLS